MFAAHCSNFFQDVMLGKTRQTR